MLRTLSRASIKIRKIDAARRQLRTAILLWFLDEDPVSIHTLVSAAHEITHTLFRRKGLSDLFFDSKVIRDEGRAEVAKSIKKAATFFKHAQKDPDGEIDFTPDVNVTLFVFVATGLVRMGETLGDIENAFLVWFGIQYPDMLTDDIYAKLVPADDLEYLRSLGKRKFLELRIKRQI